MLQNMRQRTTQSVVSQRSLYREITGKDTFPRPRTADTKEIIPVKLSLKIPVFYVILYGRIKNVAMRP